MFNPLSIPLVRRVLCTLYLLTGLPFGLSCTFAVGTMLRGDITRRLATADSALHVQDYRLAAELYDQALLNPFSSRTQLLQANVGMMYICQQLSRNKDYYFFKAAAHQQLGHLSVPPQLDHTSTAADSALYATYRSLILVEAVYLYNMRDVTESRQLLRSIGLAGVSRSSLLTLYLGSSSLYIQSLRAVMAADRLTVQGSYAAALDSLHHALSLINCFDRLRNHATAADSLTAYVPDSLDAAPVELCWLADSTRLVVPEWIAAVRSQLSITYAAMGLKPQSDYNHNVYLDILEATRVDRQPEHEYDALRSQSDSLHASVLLLAAAASLVLLLVVAACLFLRHDPRHLRRLEVISEQQQAAQLAVEREKRGYIERVSALGIALGITPFLDRALHEMQHRGASDYLVELIRHISGINDLMGDWIKMRRGNVALSITSFPLQPLFDTLRSSVPLYRKAGITLCISDSPHSVRADRDLTLFMLGTLLDNARRYTPSGGTVSVTAQASPAEGYVDITVSDTGCGFDPDSLSPTVQSGEQHQGTGFGLCNCRSIIEQYRKHSRYFSLCRFDVQSQRGRGSRFSFRLPLAVRSLIPLFLLSVTSVSAQTPLPVLLDSLVCSNIHGDYRHAVEWGDSALQHLNRRLALQSAGQPSYVLSLMGESDQVSDTELFLSGTPFPYDTLLIVRNEISIAALSLRRPMLYRYNLNAMTKLYRLMSADSQLEQRCVLLSQTVRSLRLQVVCLAVLLLLLLCGSAALLWYRYSRLRSLEETLTDDARRIELEASHIHVQNLLLDNSLSTIKHETMYYPSRILQLLQADHADTDSLASLLTYYHQLFQSYTQRAQQLSMPVPLRRQPIAAVPLLRELFPHSTIQASDSLCLYGDSHMLRAMLLDLTQGHQSQHLTFTLTHHAPYVHLAITSSQWSWTTEQQRQLFHIDMLLTAPGNEKRSVTPFFFARQVLRLHDEQSLRHGCGIQVQGPNTIICILEGKVDSVT